MGKISSISKHWKGIILAGGTGSRLYPITQVASKQLLPIYDKPMIYYPISTLMLGGIRDILIISTPHDKPLFEKLLGNGKNIGINFYYEEQKIPHGIAEAFIIAEKFIKNTNVCLILGDNLFYGSMQFLRIALAKNEGATIFAYPVHDPEKYGVVEFDKKGKVLSIEEKPRKPKSRYAIPGLYCYDNNAVTYTRQLVPSKRGELEITDLNRIYLKHNKLSVYPLGRGIAWLDTGTPQSLMEAGNFVATIEKRQGLKIGCLEEVAYRMGYISLKEMIKLAQPIKNSAYGKYLLDIAVLEQKNK